ncbi:U-box domain-containing protein 35 isoform X1 [Daucus carota subsp. sativus]|uniref:U-box domain-containing protein 35 isoform X1 n=1 Tax=Daucus carota subsp. sativus TaxID=79200 RepID=UPI0007EFAE8C|nr:PREDICTED: U-box domain-containing protein 35-like isoform X1 [Daucus carota subsp. sativus]
MWRSGGGHVGGDKKGLVAVAIDKDKGSQFALRWAVDNLLSRGQTVVLIHVLHKQPNPINDSPASWINNSIVADINGDASANKQQLEKQTKDLFLTFHCFCTRKDIQCIDVILEDTDIAKSLTEYVNYTAIENLVLGAPSRHGFIRRFKVSDIPANVSKGSPDFCTVYVIHKGKISSVRNASRSAPFNSPLLAQIQGQTNNNSFQSAARSGHSFQSAARSGQSFQSHARGRSLSMKGAEMIRQMPRNLQDDQEPTNNRSSAYSRGRDLSSRIGEVCDNDTDISFVSSGRPSTDRMPAYDSMDSGRTPRMSTSSDQSGRSSFRYGGRDSDISSLNDLSSQSSFESERTSISSSYSTNTTDDAEAEMRRLKLELQKTMEMYSTACKEALTAKQKAVELQRWRMEEEARIAEESAMDSPDSEKTKSMEAVESSEEAQKSKMHSQKELEKKEGEPQYEFRYRRYTIDEIEAATEHFSRSRKIGEGGYGPVFKCRLDHTPVAVKVLRPDATEGRSQFQREVEVLSCMRHPNMVLLMGACPEYGCLVYEYMANGSLDDRLALQGNTPPLSWRHRFRIAAEIATGLLFLHQTKPEPLVHRDLKPANILLDQNYVSKISDVGLARLVPASVANEVTQYRMTSTAGTFCYIDPEYQQTGMLGVKSDVYSFGIVLLQILTAKPAMGLTSHAGRAIDNGTFEDMLDRSIPDWPVEEALCIAKLALRCTELRRKDRPDLGKEVLPELDRLRDLADENM